MKKTLSTIVLGAALSLGLAMFTSNAFAQGAGGASAGGSGSASSAGPVGGSVRVRPVRMCRAVRESAR